VLTLEYILEAHTVDRAVAYQSQHILRRIAQYERLDLGTPSSKEFLSRLSKDRLFSSTNIPKVDPNPAIDNLRQQLKREPFKSGPKDFFALCEDLRYQIAYDYLYPVDAVPFGAFFLRVASQMQPRSAA
jgi:hypothetical protein